MSIAPELSRGIFYKTRVDDVMAHTPVTCPCDLPVREMAAIMRENGVGSLVVVEGDQEPVGIATERDLVYKVLAEEKPNQTARDIMSSPLVTVRPGEFLYQALYLMMRNRCRRLVVVSENGDLAGILSMRDIFSLEGYEARVIMERIEKASNIEELCEVRPDIDGFIQKLFIGEVDGWTLTAILTDFNDAVTRRILFLNQQALRGQGYVSPLCSFAWVGFGSEGRREQVLRGDQDNGIIMMDAGCGPGAREHFRELARRVNDDLAAYGFDLCEGGVMAREDKYFGTLTEWKYRVYDMIHHAQDSQCLRDLTILLDCRLIYGDENLVSQLWDSTLHEFDRYPVSLRYLAEDATTKPVPLSFFGRLQYEKDGEGRRGINVKKYGMLPLTAGVKALATDHRIRATSNVERITMLHDLGAIEKDSADNLLFAHELFLRLKVQTSAERVFQGHTRSHFFYPEEWTEWERENLKRAFRAVDHLHSLLRFHFVR